MLPKELFARGLAALRVVVALRPLCAKSGRSRLLDRCIRRRAEPEEVAAAILFLAIPAASMITGHTLVVDGGYLAP